MKNAEVKLNADPDNPEILNISFRGDLNITNIQEFHELILPNISKYNTFNIETRDVDALDMSFYQLLLSLRKTLEENDKSFNIKLSLHAEQEELLKQAGFGTEITKST